MFKKIALALLLAPGISGAAIGGATLVSASSSNPTSTAPAVNSTAPAERPTATATTHRNCPHMGSSAGNASTGGPSA
jgi:hypothetical protein